MLAAVTLRRTSCFIRNARHKACSFHALIMRNTKTLLKLILLVAAAAVVAQAHAGKFKVEAAIAVDQDTKPATTFAAIVPKLYAFFKSTGTHEGDKLRGVWIAVDVGDAAPANTKIDEANLTADQDDFYGAFSLTKPTKGWPVGKYRVDIYNGDELATSVKFTIKTGKAQGNADDESSDDSSDE
jgi:hypothetical protein